MGEYGAIVIGLMWLGGLVLVILWIALPIAVFRSNDHLKALRKELGQIHTELKVTNGHLKTLRSGLQVRPHG